MKYVNDDLYRIAAVMTEFNRWPDHYAIVRGRRITIMPVFDDVPRPFLERLEKHQVRVDPLAFAECHLALKEHVLTIKKKTEQGEITNDTVESTKAANGN